VQVNKEVTSRFVCYCQCVKPVPDSVWPLSDKEIKAKSGHGTRRRSRPYSSFETEINMGDHPGGRGGGASNKFRNSSLPAVTKQHESCLSRFDRFLRRMQLAFCLQTIRRSTLASKRNLTLHYNMHTPVLSLGVPHTTATFHTGPAIKMQLGCGLLWSTTIRNASDTGAVA
jgi:hypothetical protein